MTQSSSLSPEVHTVRCVVGSEPTNGDCLMPSIVLVMVNVSIDDAYFSGVAIMHGSPRQHVWTFAAGARENFTTVYFYYRNMCPCEKSGYYNPPPFVGEDYFCELGYVFPGYYGSWERLHCNDTLWDGKDCHSTSTCCSFHNPPYFTKSLSETTTDDLELRMCVYNLQFYENLAIELVDLYVKSSMVDCGMHGSEDFQNLLLN